MLHLKIRIEGRVQGVFYRASTKEKALEVGLKGFVQNQQDGSVYAEVEGSEAQLQAFVNWCHQGPPMANVSKVETSIGDVVPFTTFEVKY